jgi:hypothetical protein
VFQRRAAVNLRLSIALCSWQRRIALLNAFQRHDRGFETAANLANVGLLTYFGTCFPRTAPGQTSRIAPNFRKAIGLSVTYGGTCPVISFAECKPARTSHWACYSRGQVQKHRIDDGSRCK